MAIATAQQYSGCCAVITPQSQSAASGAAIRHTLGRHTASNLQGLLALALFQLVEIWLVAQLGSRELAAMGYITPFVLMLLALLLGIELATSVHLARIKPTAVASRNRLWRQLFNFSLWLTLPLALLGWWWLEPLLQLLAVAETLRPLVVDYLSYWLLSYPLLALIMLSAGALRGMAQPRRAAKLVL